MAQIRRIEVDKLFGLYDHRIDLHHQEHITLLHGPNGVGKTALLRLLNALLNRNFAALRSVPFQEFRVYFTDSHWIRVKQIDTPVEPTLFSNSLLGLQLDVYKGKKILKGEALILSSHQQELYEYLIRHFSSSKSSSLSKWITHSSRQSLPTEAILKILSSSDQGEIGLPESIRRDLMKSLDSQPLADLLGENRAYLIGTNRLLPPSKTSRRYLNLSTSSKRAEESTEEPESAVEYHANVIRDTIAATLAQYSGVSSQRDRTFPERLVHGRRNRANLSGDQLRQRLADLEYRRRELESAGLLDSHAAGSSFTVPDALDETTLTVLSVYVDDTEQKLAVFDDVEARIALLKQIVDKRFLRSKQFSIDRRRGFVFQAGGKELAPEQLSSGEQHELVLFCELLFTVPSGSIILIDEPELSLHVAWQLEFLTDLQAVTRIRPMDILIATHSPWIVNNRWDLTARLGEDQSETSTEAATISDLYVSSKAKPRARVER